MAEVSEPLAHSGARTVAGTRTIVGIEPWLSEKSGRGNGALLGRWIRVLLDIWSEIPLHRFLQRFMSFGFGMYRKSVEHVPGEALIGRSGRAMYAIDSMNCFCLLSTMPIMSS